MTPATLAARDSAAVFLLEGRTHVDVTGADRVAFLNGFCTNDIKSLAPGQSCEAFFCNVKGHVVAHASLFVSEQSIWLETVPGAAAGLIAHLDRYIIREDVQLHDRTQTVQELIFVGPQCGDALSRWLIASGHDSLSVVDATMGTGPLRIHRVQWLGTESSLVVGSQDNLRPHCTTLGTAADWEALRIDAGFPTYGVDLTEDNLPQEAARDAQCISYTKGCYLGQEPIARLHSMGHTNRELRRLTSETATIPVRGAELLDPATQHVAGQITSAAANPFGEGVVALGMVKRNYFTPGTRLQSAHGEFTVR